MSHTANAHTTTTYTRARPAAEHLTILIASAQRTVLHAERQAKTAGCDAEVAALVAVRSHLLDAEWAASEADIAADDQAEVEAQAEKNDCQEHGVVDLSNADAALRTLLAHELDRAEDEPGAIAAFTRSAGVGFRECLNYARGRKHIAGSDKPAHMPLARAQAVAAALGYKLVLIQAE